MAIETGEAGVNVAEIGGTVLNAAFPVLIVATFLFVGGLTVKAFLFPSGLGKKKD